MSFRGRCRNTCIFFLTIVIIVFLILPATVYSDQSANYTAPNDYMTRRSILVTSTIGYEDNSCTSCLTPDGKRLIKCVGFENRLCFFDISGEGLEDKYTDFDCTLPNPCPVVQVTSDGSLVAAGGSWNGSLSPQSIYIINTSTEQIDQVINASHQYFEISPDGRYVTTIDPNSNSGIYWISNGSPVMNLNDQYSIMEFSPDGQYLIAYNDQGNGYIEILKFSEMSRQFMMNGKANFSLSPNRSNIISWSKNGKLIAVAFATDNVIKVVETSTWQVIQELSPTYKQYSYTSVAFSPDSSYLAVGASNWDSEGISLGLQIYNTNSWSRVYDEPHQIDHEEDFVSVLEATSEYMDIGFLDGRYPIFDSITWRPDGSVFLSATLYEGSIPTNPNNKATVAEVDDTSNDNFNDLLPIISIIIILIILCSLIILFYFRPHLLPIPSYSKLDPNDLKNQITRRNILQFIQTHPGCIFSEIKTSLEGSYSNFYYHISVLEREQLIFTKFLGLRKRFYSSNYPKFSKLFPQNEHYGLYEKIFLLLLKYPGLTQKEIAIKLNVSEPTVSRYILDLLTENFIKRERDGKVWRCYSNPYTET